MAGPDRFVRARDGTLIAVFSSGSAGQAMDEIDKILSAGRAPTT